ncbi:MAG: ABC transporter permease [Verrucomicrobiaceae bacterium]|nr:MAG: ABC transporter permease [Verrucomicrobiaceae bacterium]
MLSSFTLISLIGVMLGVMVLVVVMAVYSGLERDVKERLLGFSPHVLLRHADLGVPDGPMADWNAVAEKAKELPFVESAEGYVEDYVLLDIGSWQKPVKFYGVDTSKPAQIEGLTKMLDTGDFPESSADMGLDDRVVVSSTLINGFRESGMDVGIGSKLKLYSARNFEQVMKAYKATDRPPLREEHPEEWKEIETAFSTGWKTQGDKVTFPYKLLQDTYGMLDGLRASEIREQEAALIEEIMIALDPAESDEAAGIYVLPAASKATITEKLEALRTTDAEKMNSDAFKNLKTIVMPKEAEIIGVYKSSQMANTPDVFSPLHLAQALAGLDSSVQGISLRLTNADLSDQAAAEARRALGAGWYVSTWGDQYESFFLLINQQRAMMYFALSFIVLVSAFSMMAVMFTVTIQKRREIGVMKALGAAPSQIIRVFLYQGMILGVFGSLLGVILGRVVIHFRGEIQSALRTVGFDPFSANFTGFGVLPAHNNPVEQAMFALMGFVLCSLAALVPAFFAARSDAAKSLRNL